jgi:hypothetical protein
MFVVLDDDAHSDTNNSGHIAVRRVSPAATMAT